MSDELIKRMRDKAGVSSALGEKYSANLFADAAALIEQQAARIAALESAAKAEPVAEVVGSSEICWVRVTSNGLKPGDKLYTAPAASLAQPLEAQADARDAERYRWLRERFTGYDFDWMPSEPDADDGKSVAVFNVGRDFRGGRDITAAIDAALANQKQAG